MLIKDKIILSDSKRKYSDEGFLQVPAKISRTGIQTYLASEMGIKDEPQKIIRVYRPEQEVFSQDSLNSFSSKPVTNNHPPELVTAKNAKQYTVGLSSPDVVKDGEFVTTVLNITDADAIKQVEAGKVELSNGYVADIDWTPGITQNGEQYDAIQRNIKGNHIALVERGRAGSACRLSDNLIQNQGGKMSTITIDGVDFEVSEQAMQAVNKQQQRLTDMKEEMSKKDLELKKKKEDEEEAKKTAKKTEDSLQAKIDDLESKVPDPGAIDKMVADRLTLVDSIKKICPELVCDGKNADELMKEVVADKCPSVQLDSVSQDYVQARFDMLLESAGSTAQSQLDSIISQQMTKDSEGNVQDLRPASVKAREKFMLDSRNAYKKQGAK